MLPRAKAAAASGGVKIDRRDVGECNPAFSSAAIVTLCALEPLANADALALEIGERADAGSPACTRMPCPLVIG